MHDSFGGSLKSSCGCFEFFFSDNDANDDAKKREVKKESSGLNDDG